MSNQTQSKSCRKIAHKRFKTIILISTEFNVIGKEAIKKLKFQSYNHENLLCSIHLYSSHFIDIYIWIAHVSPKWLLLNVGLGIEPLQLTSCSSYLSNTFFDPLKMRSIGLCPALSHVISVVFYFKRETFASLTQIYQKMYSYCTDSRFTLM